MMLYRSFQVIALSIVLALYLLFSQQAVVSQSPCPTIPALYPNNPPKGTWPSGATVRVNIDPAFTQEQKDSIVAALRNWNNANGYNGNNSLVSLSEPFTYNQQPLGSSFTSYNLQITKDTTIPAQGNTSRGGTENYRTYGEIKLNTDSIPTFPGWFQHVAAHEIV